MPAADVCLIVEGCYPYVQGGVAAWIDWLMRSCPELTFSIVALWPRPTGQAPRYSRPPNVVGYRDLYLQDFGDRPKLDSATPVMLDHLADTLSEFTATGGAQSLRSLNDDLARLRRFTPLQVAFNSPIAWQIVQRMYALDMPQSSFLHYFWAWRALLGGLFAVAEFPLPKARVYHTISTGYAGLLAARAAVETGKPALLTEHGIYTNERRVELLMADWVADNIDKGHDLSDARIDLRDLWVQAFEAYARTCYETADTVVTLYRDNQQAQCALGADPSRLKVIANGIDLERFSGVAQAADSSRPTMALIGRVVPIKDVKTYIAAAGILKKRIPNVRALVLGPLDEDEIYAAECRALVRELQLEDTVIFTGSVDVAAYFSEIHVAVLTSLSESQPLVLLEAGAASVPFVATNVGSCREIIEGSANEEPPLGPGGIVTGLVAPGEVADAVAVLLTDHDRRRAAGRALKARVEQRYTSAQAAAAYHALYADLMARRRQPSAAATES
ncbi:MAG: GT4 family glycosyltransferase PelF [Hyphomicrobiaceae bacterium]|nr:GT4 family glycosyltransferase PelF [Hyphomicrobiaceae bacterium]